MTAAYPQSCDILPNLDWVTNDYGVWFHDW